jgi:hypothetical protein
LSLGNHDYFKDDVMVTVVPQPDARPLVAMRAVSRVGKGDLGTNTRHVLNLYEMLEKSAHTARSSGRAAERDAATQPARPGSLGCRSSSGEHGHTGERVGGGDRSST